MHEQMANTSNHSPPPNAQSPWILLRSASYHPFIYRKMVRTVDPAAQPGDIVHVYDKSGTLFGRGMFNPRSQIVVRMLTHRDTPIDDAFWRHMLSAAVDLRRQHNLDAVTDAYRLIHSEGDGLSGLIAERYADCLVFEVFSLGMFHQLERLQPLLADVLGPPTALDRPDRARSTWRTAIRADGRAEKLEGFRLSPPHEHDDPVRRVTIREHDIRFRVDVQGGHKTGFFCDQRENRRQLARLCQDATLLDICCYTGGFSLHAAIHGNAHSITGVDLDEEAIAVAKENANLNQTRIDFVHADAFSYMRQMLANNRQYDVVVVDPPKLAQYRSEVDDALRKYHDFNHLATQLVRPGGILLTCSCTGLVYEHKFMEVVHQAASRAGRVLQRFDRTGAGPDHPIMTNCPESEYLKALWFRVP